MHPKDLISEVLSAFPCGQDGWTAPLTRTELTRRFCHHPGRDGALSTARLYGRLIPVLLSAGIARAVKRKGKPSAFQFRQLTVPELVAEFKARSDKIDFILADPHNRVSEDGKPGFKYTPEADAAILQLCSAMACLKGMLRAIQPDHPQLSNELSSL